MNTSMQATAGAQHLPPIAAAYVRATNDHDAAAFIGCFAEGAIVNDAGREFRGIEAIKAWSDREIMDAQVTLEVLGVAERDGEVVITTKVDGNFDRMGLPDPVIIDHRIAVENGKIGRLRCRLTGVKPGP
jgi:SnoaL-like domain